MVTDQSRTLAQHLGGQVTRCGYCPKQVVFQPTLFGGKQLCFDAKPMPVRHDRDRTGWVQGMHPVGEHLCLVYVPWELRRTARGQLLPRPQTVLQLHLCAGQNQAVAA